MAWISGHREQLRLAGKDEAMSLLDPFTKPRWQHDKPNVRREAVAELEDPEILRRIVLEDPDESVRASALDRIGDGESLDRLIDALSGDLQQQARRQRLQTLLAEPGDLGQIEDEAVLLRIVDLADDPGLLTAAMDRIESVPARMELALGHPVARVRLSAAQGIDDIENLRELMNACRHKDKAVFRHCKEKVDAHHAAEREAADRQDGLRKLAEDARTLSKAVDSPEFSARCQTLETRWEAFDGGGDEPELARIRDDLDICRKRVEHKEAALAAEQEQLATVAAAEQTFSELVAELEAIDPTRDTLSDADAIGALEQQLDSIEERWLGALHHARPSSEQNTAGTRLLQQWRAASGAARRVLESAPALAAIAEDSARVDAADFLGVEKLRHRAERLATRLAWPDALAAIAPEPVTGLQEGLAGLQQLMDKLREKEKKNLEKLDSAFETLRRELDAGHFDNADREHSRVRNFIRQLGPKRQERLQRELLPLTAKLREIHDWQGFAIEPKKQELIGHMQALIGSEEPADSLAARIKALQDEWKELGSLGPRRDQALWKQFKAAADEAYAPCKEAFSEQARIKRANYKQRMDIVAQLAQYDRQMGWPDAEQADPAAPPPDWRLVQKTLDTARAAFNEIKPVNRRDERRSRQALKKVCDRIYAHIKKEYGRNIALKEALVQQARENVATEDLHAAIDNAKRIQREWKDVGITPRQVDRRLWKELRAACDDVFGRLDAQRAERNAEAQAHKEKAERRKQRERQRWPNLSTRMQACALHAEDAGKAAQMWEQSAEIPQGVDTAALEQWWEQGTGEAGEDILREACIAMEVFAGQDSPAADKEARMAYQMQHLFEGSAMGTGHNERLLELINQFIALRPPTDWVGRFCASMEAARGRN
jgi:hypothetical protein